MARRFRGEFNLDGPSSPKLRLRGRVVDGKKHFEGRFSIVGADSADGNVQSQRSSSCGPLAAWSQKRDEGIPTLDPSVRNASMCVRKGGSILRSASELVDRQRQSVHWSGVSNRSAPSECELEQCRWDGDDRVDPPRHSERDAVREDIWEAQSRGSRGSSVRPSPRGMYFVDEAHTVGRSTASRSPRSSAAVRSVSRPRRASEQRDVSVDSCRRSSFAVGARERTRASESDAIRREPSMSPSRCDDQHRSSALRSASCARESSRTSYLSPALSEAPPQRTQDDQEDPQHSRSSCRPRLSSRYGRVDDESPRAFRNSLPSRGSVHLAQMDQRLHAEDHLDELGPNSRSSSRPRLSSRCGRGDEQCPQGSRDSRARDTVDLLCAELEMDEECGARRSRQYLQESRHQSPDDRVENVRSSLSTERLSNWGSSVYGQGEYLCNNPASRQVSHADESFRGSQMGGRASLPRGSDNLDRGTPATRPRSRNSHGQQRPRSQSDLRYASDVEDVRYSEHHPRESLPSAGSRRDGGVQHLDMEVGRSKESSVGQCAGSACIPSDFAYDEEVFYDPPVQVFHDPRHRSPDDRQSLHGSLRERQQRTSSRESCSGSRRPDPPRPSSQANVRRSEPEPRSSSRGSHVRRPSESAQDYPRHSEVRDARASQSGARSPQASCRGARVSARASAVESENNGRACRSLDRHQGNSDRRISACEEPCGSSCRPEDFERRLDFSSCAESTSSLGIVNIVESLMNSVVRNNVYDDLEGERAERDRLRPSVDDSGHQRASRSASRAAAGDHVVGFGGGASSRASSRVSNARGDGGDVRPSCVTSPMRYDDHQLSSLGRPSKNPQGHQTDEQAHAKTWALNRERTMSPPSGDYRRRSSVQKSLVCSAPPQKQSNALGPSSNHEVSRRGCSADGSRERTRASESDTMAPPQRTQDDQEDPQHSRSSCMPRLSNPYGRGDNESPRAFRDSLPSRGSVHLAQMDQRLHAEDNLDDLGHISQSSCRPRLSSRCGRGDDESPRAFRDSLPSHGSVHQPQMDQDQRRSTQTHNEHDELCDVLRSALRHQSPDEVAAVIKSSFPTAAYDPDREYFCDDTPPRQSMRSSQYECPREVSHADESFRGSQMGGRTSPPRGSDNLDRGTPATRPRSRNSHGQQRPRSQSELRYASDVEDVRYSEHHPRESLPSAGSRHDDGVQHLDMEFGRSKESSVGQCAGSACIPSDFAYDEEVFYDPPVQVFHDPRHRSPDDRQSLHGSLRERQLRTSSRESCRAYRRPDPPRPSSQVDVRRSEPEPRSSSRDSHVRRPSESAQDYPRHSEVRDARVSQSGGPTSCHGARVSARTSAVDCQNDGRASRSMDLHQANSDKRLSACEEPRRRPSHSPHGDGRSHREISSRRDEDAELGRVSGRNSEGVIPSVAPEMVTSAQNPAGELPVGSGPLRGVFRGTWLSDTSSDVTRNSDQESIRQETQRMTHMGAKCTTSFNTVPEVEMMDEMERGLSPSPSCSGARLHSPSLYCHHGSAVLYEPASDVEGHADDVHEFIDREEENTEPSRMVFEDPRHGSPSPDARQRVRVPIRTHTDNTRCGSVRRSETQQRASSRDSCKGSRVNTHLGHGSAVDPGKRSCRASCTEVENHDERASRSRGRYDGQGSSHPQRTAESASHCASPGGLGQVPNIVDEQAHRCLSLPEVSMHRDHSETSDVQPATEPCSFSRAECRFTKPSMETYLGVGTRALLPRPSARAVFALDDFEHAALSLLFERCEKARHATCSTPGDAALLAGLVLDLGISYGLHCQALAETGKVIVADGTAALLAIAVHLVETLDAVVASEDVTHTLESCATFSAAHLCTASELPSTVFGPGGFVSASLDILGGKLKALLKDLDALALAEELELHAALIVRLVLRWEPPLGAPHPSNMLLAVGGDHILVNLALELLHERLRDEEMLHTDQGRKDLGLLAVVEEGLHICFRKASTSRLSAWRWTGGRSSDAQRRGHRPSETVAPLAPIAEGVLTLAVGVASQAGDIPVACRADCASAADGAAASAVDMIAVLTVASLGPPEAVNADSVAKSLAEFLKEQAPSVRLLQSLRRLVAKPSHTMPWLLYSGVHPHQRMCQALVEEDVIPLCIQGVHDLLQVHRSSSALEAPDNPCEASLAKEVKLATQYAARMCTLFQHLEAIVQELSGGGGSQLQEVRALRDQCVGSGRGETSRPSAMLYNLSQLRQAIRQSCFAPMWR